MSNINIDKAKEIAKEISGNLSIINNNCSKIPEELSKKLEIIDKENPKIIYDIIRELAKPLYMNNVLAKHPIVYDEDGKIVGFKESIRGLELFTFYNVVDDPKLTKLIGNISNFYQKSCVSK